MIPATQINIFIFLGPENRFIASSLNILGEQLSSAVVESGEIQIAHEYRHALCCWFTLQRMPPRH
jgi:hypothetical protein